MKVGFGGNSPVGHRMLERRGFAGRLATCWQPEIRIRARLMAVNTGGHREEETDTERLQRKPSTGAAI